MKMVDKDAREAHYTPCRKSELAGISLHFTLMDNNFSVQNYLFHSYKYHFRLKMCQLKGVGYFILDVEKLLSSSVSAIKLARIQLIIIHHHYCLVF